MAKKRTKAQRRAAALASWARRKAGSVAAAPTKGVYSLPLLNTREATHGDYGVNAGISQGIKAVFHGSPEYLSKLNAKQKESAELIATKFGRIVSGDPNLIQHWEDLAGYATLIVEDLRNAANAAKK